ncbi:MAG: hypothetical protein FD141_775 [Fusobacteria bacterium]|nr:MAG: hypothetical protein FD141_775 [Fusobacteriota bacterium]KAF0228559.1 MAG: hypothetical protein FD182_815 [Fusobacteriota bacterium]
MKNQKIVKYLIITILILATFTSLMGLLSSKGSGSYDYTSINGEIVEIYGKGIYKNDSVSVVAQGKASDIVTLFLAIPILAFATIYSLKGSLRARLLLTGTLGYFLYTYMSYSFLWNYNPLFIVYVILMSTSMFAFILSLMSFDVEKIPSMFKEKLPIRFLAGFQFFIALMLGLLWLGKISSSIFSEAIPVGLEHYTTLVIQAMDLGFIVPIAVISGVLLLMRKPFGYLFTSIIIIKAITMLTSITAMIINSYLSGVVVNPIEVIVFSAFNLLAIIAFVILIKNINELK